MLPLSAAVVPVFILARPGLPPTAAPSSLGHRLRAEEAAVVGCGFDMPATVALRRPLTDPPSAPMTAICADGVMPLTLELLCWRGCGPRPLAAPLLTWVVRPRPCRPAGGSSESAGAISKAPPCGDVMLCSEPKRLLALPAPAPAAALPSGDMPTDGMLWVLARAAVGLMDPAAAAADAAVGDAAAGLLAPVPPPSGSPLNGKAKLSMLLALGEAAPEWPGLTPRPLIRAAATSDMPAVGDPEGPPAP